MTNAERQKLMERTQLLNARMAELEQYSSNPVVADIMNEYTQEINKLDSLIGTKREYMYNFIGGGWNSEWAYTQEEAIEQAQARWGEDKRLQVDIKSFSVATDAALKTALSLFY